MHALVQNGARGAAAVVADSIQIHHASQAGSMCASDGEVIAEADWVQIIVGIVVRKVTENLASVRRFPPEQLEWELVGVIPCRLLSYEVIYARSLVYLR